MAGPTPNPIDAQAGLHPRGVGKINEYTFCPGVCVLPLAEDPPTDETELRTYSPVLTAKLHAPFRIRKVVYDTDKVNNPVVGIPAPSDAGAFVFLGGSMAVATVLNTSLVNFDWKIATEYSFVENCASRTQDGFVLGSSPVPVQSSVDNANSVGLSIGQPASTLPVPGAIARAGNDAKAGYFMATNVQNNLYGTWGYNQDSYLPGCVFNTAIVNSDLNTQPISQSGSGSGIVS